METHKKYPMYSIQRNIKLLLYFLAPVFLLNILTSIFVYRDTVSRDSIRIEETLNLYLNNLESQLKSTEHFLAWSVLYEDSLDILRDSSNLSLHSEEIQKFQARVREFQYSLDKSFQFYLYLSDQDFFANCSSLRVSYPEFLRLKDYYTQQIQQGTPSQLKWTLLKTDEDSYIYYLITVHDCSLLCQISLKDLSEPLEDLSFGRNGYIRFVIDGQSFYITPEGILDTVPNNASLKEIYYRSADIFPASVTVLTNQFNAVSKLLFLQLIVIAIAIILIVALGAIYIYMNHRVIQPIRQFSENLASVNESSDLLNLQDSSIIELEQANEQFKNLMREIKKLKINIYEQELEKKKIQMDFMQLQIRPHFYLNCLTTIYSMAQTQLYEEIAQMSLTTAKYLRYLLNNNRDFVQVSQEIAHIEDYLSIQQMRYGDIFQWNCQLEEEVSNALLPPLILQTFIENSVKYAVSPEEHITIKLQISKKEQAETDFLFIEISDTGPGFPDDVLHTLSILEQPPNHPSESWEFTFLSSVGTEADRAHIGITNAIQRLHLLYENHSTIHFDNLSTGGALVTLLIPYRT